MAKCLLRLQPRRLLPRNPHPTKSMPTSRFRPSTLAMRIFIGALAVFAFVGGDGLHAGSIAHQSKSADASSAPAAKAEASDPAQDRAKIKVSVNLVNVLVSVLDEHNRPAADLPIEAFRVLDEDNPQAIAVFEKETQQPLDLALMIDASLSAQLGMPSQREAAAHFIQQVLRSGDRLAVYAFDENVTQLAAFSD